MQPEPQTGQAGTVYAELPATTLKLGWQVSQQTHNARLLKQPTAHHLKGGAGVVALVAEQSCSVSKPVSMHPSTQQIQPASDRHT